MATTVKVAAVQLAGVRDRLGPKGDRLVQSPYTLAGLDDELDFAVLRARMQLPRALVERVHARAEQRYVDSFREKLRQVLRYCYLNEVHLVALPAELVPLECLPVLSDFSSRISILAGLGSMSRRDLKGVEADLGTTATGTDVHAVFMSPRGNYLWDGAYREIANVPAGTTRIARLGVSSSDEPDPAGASAGVRLRTRPSPDSVPATSGVSVAAADAASGGAAIRWPQAAQAEPVRLPPSTEGLVIGQVGMGRRSQRPAAARRVSVVYDGRDPGLGPLAATLRAALGEPPLDSSKVQDIAEPFAADLERAVERAPVFGSAVWAMTTLTETEQDTLDLELIALPETILALDELSYLGLSDVIDALPDRSPQEPVRPGAADDGSDVLRVRELLSAAQTSLVPNVRVGLLRLAHRAPQSDEESEHWLFFAVLTTFNPDELERSLSRQLGVLRALADLSQYAISVRYRNYTAKPDDGAQLEAYCEVLCTVRGCSPAVAEELREGFGQALHSALVGVYALSFALARPGSLENTSKRRLEAPAHVVEIRRAFDTDGRVLPFAGVPDYGHIDDFLKSLTFPVVLELECTAAPSSADIPSADAVAEQTTSPEARSLLATVASAGADFRRVRLTVRVGSDERLPPGVAEFIGAQLGGPSPVRIGPPGSLPDDDETAFTPAQALRVFHPPFGEVFRSTARMHGLSMPISRQQFPPGGVAFGTAVVRHARQDRRVDVRVSDADRSRHLYVIGKTGTGKTNFLKSLVSQDLAVPGRGVLVVDPHGDLADHALNSVPRLRLDDVTYLDFGRPDETPVVNPLALATRSTGDRDRAVEEFLELLRSRVFHQWTGPRFEDLVRLALHTTVDKGYPLPSSILEVPRLFIDEAFQAKVRARLEDPDLRKQWDLHQKTSRSTEYGATIQWVTSKMSDFTRDSTLRSAFAAGDNALDFREVLDNNRIVIVRLPESVIGANAANAIGSLLLLQLRGALLGRNRTGKDPDPFYVYVDEFQNFATTDIDRVVAEARKFGTGFVLAHQNLEQLREFSEHTGVLGQRLIRAILGNVASIVAFSVGAPDAEELAPFFGVPRDTMLRISRYTALARTTVDGVDTGPFTLQTRQTVPAINPRLVDDIEQRMRQTGTWIAREAAEQHVRTLTEQAQALTTPTRPFALPSDAPPAAPADPGAVRRARRSARPDSADPADPAPAPAGPATTAPAPPSWAPAADEPLQAAALGETPTAPNVRADTQPSPSAAPTGRSKSAAAWNAHAGPFISIRRAARQLQTTDAAVHALIDQRDLLALTTADGVPVLPARQFTPTGQITPGLGAVLRRFPPDAVATPWTIASWLFQPREALQDRTPIQWLAQDGSVDYLCGLADHAVRRLRL